KFLHENRPGGAQLVHHVFVMDNLLADIDRRAIQVQRDLHDVNGPDHPGAKPAGTEQQYLSGRGTRRSCAHETRSIITSSFQNVYVDFTASIIKRPSGSPTRFRAQLNRRGCVHSRRSVAPVLWKATCTPSSRGSGGGGRNARSSAKSM